MELKIFKNKLMCGALLFGFTFLGCNKFLSQNTGNLTSFFKVSAGIGIESYGTEDELAAAALPLMKAVVTFSDAYDTEKVNMRGSSNIGQLGITSRTTLVGDGNVEFKANLYDNIYIPVVSAANELGRLCAALKDEIVAFKTKADDNQRREYLKGVLKNNGAFDQALGNANSILYELTVGKDFANVAFNAASGIVKDDAAITAWAAEFDKNDNFEAASKPGVRGGVVKSLKAFAKFLKAAKGAELYDEVVKFASMFNFDAVVDGWTKDDDYSTRLQGVFDTATGNTDNNFTEANVVTNADTWVPAQVKKIRGVFRAFFNAVMGKYNGFAATKADDTKFKLTFDVDTGLFTILDTMDIVNADKDSKISIALAKNAKNLSKPTSIVSRYFETEKKVWDFVNRAKRYNSQFFKGAVGDVVSVDLKKRLAPLKQDKLKFSDTKSEFFKAMRVLGKKIGDATAYLDQDGLDALDAVSIEQPMGADMKIKPLEDLTLNLMKTWQTKFRNFYDPLLSMLPNTTEKNDLINTHMRAALVTHDKDLSKSLKKPAMQLSTYFATKWPLAAGRLTDVVNMGALFQDCLWFSLLTDGLKSNLDKAAIANKAEELQRQINSKTALGQAIGDAASTPTIAGRFNNAAVNINSYLDMAKVMYMAAGGYDNTDPDTKIVLDLPFSQNDFNQNLYDQLRPAMDNAATVLGMSVNAKTGGYDADQGTMDKTDFSLLNRDDLK